MAKVEEEVRGLVSGSVERFSGESVEEISVQLAIKKSAKTEIGWGRSTPGKGDAFTFFAADWRLAMLASPLSHMGKHTPLLPLASQQLPSVYRNYLEFLRPRGIHPEPPFMHAFVLGDMRQIPFDTQIDIEEKIKFEETMDH